ncbi:DnaA N-terminal domain-containing protein [Amaricoccus macauensis]|uniref:DnaA N-terminal domain-containing protein n=1 Tax=Amaricoccus macauensis TaxID=57001 RepID=UPI003C7B6B27
MQLARPIGREAASRKYDILSAMMAYAFTQNPMGQKQVLRLMALITTRYNWQRDELAIGQNEIARLWGVDPRTVKREMARLRSRSWLRLKKQGTRGRVSIYGLDLTRILEDTRAAWPNIGPDFVERLTIGDDQAAPSNVVPIRPVPAPRSNGTLWAQVQGNLHANDPASYAAWFEPLKEVSVEASCLTLAAPTRFHASYVEGQLKTRLMAAVISVDPAIRTLRIIY